MFLKVLRVAKGGSSETEKTCTHIHTNRFNKQWIRHDSYSINTCGYFYFILLLNNSEQLSKNINNINHNLRVYSVQTFLPLNFCCISHFLSSDTVCIAVWELTGAVALMMDALEAEVLPIACTRRPSKPWHFVCDGKNEDKKRDAFERMLGLEGEKQKKRC